MIDSVLDLDYAHIYDRELSQSHQASIEAHLQSIATAIVTQINVKPLTAADGTALSEHISPKYTAHLTSGRTLTYPQQFAARVLLTQTYPDCQIVVLHSQATIDARAGKATVYLNARSINSPPGVARVHVFVTDFERLRGCEDRWLCTRLDSFRGFGGDGWHEPEDEEVEHP